MSLHRRMPTTPPKNSWRDRIAQFHLVPRALKLVWDAAPGWTAASMVILVIQGLLPVLTVYLTRNVVNALVAVIQNSGDPAALVAEGIRPVRLPAEMAAFGVQTEGAPARPAALIDLTSPDAPTEYRLGFNNFFVLTRYNRSSFYAAAVMDLAERLRAARPETPAN